MGFFQLQYHRSFAGTLAKLLLIFFLVGFGSVPAVASAESVVPELEPVVVVGTVESSASGKRVMSEDQISVLPKRNGNVEELLTLMPGVQASDESNTSFLSGEILPPLLSISGGRPYDNNFLIDGLGNNSMLDPGSETPAGSSIDVPGHPEELFLSSYLVKEVEVYDNNIPARFGGFTGGVVNIETIDPAAVLEGTVRYRTTRDDWTEFHIDPADQTAFDNSFTEAKQPRFEKHDTGFDLSIPVSDRSGFLVSYQLLYSKIPLQNFGQTDNQTRKSENYLLKYVNNFSDGKKITLQGLHNPYDGEYFLDRTKSSAFTIKGGGSQISAEYEQLYGQGRLIVNAGLSFSENSRKAPPHHRNWADTDSKNWGSSVGLSDSREGGFGDIDKSQKSMKSGVDWLSDIIEGGNSTHQINSGLQIDFSQASFERKNTSYAYKTAVVGIIACGTDTFACDGTSGSEQYLSKRNVYQAIDVDANIAQLAVYLDDKINFKKLEFRPGLRISYDDFMENTNIAPRLSAKYDLFDNSQTELIAGWNRYYTRTLLTYKLREAIIPRTQERSSVVDNDSEWTDTALIWPSESEYSILKTPFSDEIVLGVNQVLLGGRLDLRFVKRDGADEFARDKDPFDFSDFNATLFNRLNNNGESHYESYRLSWERSWVHQFMSFNVTYSESTTSNSSYNDRLEPSDFDPDDRIWLDGELLWPNELPRQNYNRHWVANLVYSVNLPHGFQFTNITNYRNGYRDIEDAGSTININGVDHDVYSEFNRPSSTIFDWKIDWTPPIIPEKVMTMTLEIFNVFNKKAHVGTASDEFEIGRQFWAGVEYRF